jgi:hypothetical protein
MLSGIKHIPVLNKQDVYHFVLASRHLPLSKDLVRYIARNFFYNWELESDLVFYTGGLKKDKNHETVARVYEELKVQRIVKYNFSSIGWKNVALIAYAYAYAGKKVGFTYDINMAQGLCDLGLRVGEMFKLKFENGGCIRRHAVYCEYDLIISTSSDYFGDYWSILVCL